jgi:hypothetical protein
MLKKSPTVTQSHPGLPFCNLADTKVGNTYPPRGDVLGNYVGLAPRTITSTLRNKQYKTNITDKFDCEENITLLYNISNTDLLVHLPQKIVETASRCSYP